MPQSIPSPAAPGWTAALVLHNLLALAANLSQVCGVLVWGWDTFQILMLYWMDTLLVGIWALLRLAALPANQLGVMTVNGREVAATHTLLLQMFVPIVAVMMGGHLLLLWVMFSGTGTQGLHGPTGFVSRFVVESGAWAPLLLTLLTGAVGFGRSMASRDDASERRTAVSQPVDGVGAAIGGALGRLVLMQIAIIVGGMFARSYGSAAPWLVLIALRTMLDYQRPDRGAARLTASSYFTK